MKFMRDQRQRHGYDPKTKHVLFGQDADLILLALLTHEPHFRIFREEMPLHGNRERNQLPDIVELNIGELRRYLKFGLDPFRPPPDQEEDSEEASGSDSEAPEDPNRSATEEPERDFGFEQTLEDFVCLTFVVGRFTDCLT